ncbi:MAG: glycosyltransferase 87 family protein [Crocinitomicaceae bacterium]
MNRNSIAAFVLTFLYAIIIYWIAYQTDRTAFHVFILYYLVGFSLFYILFLNRQGWSFNMFFAVAIILRLILLFSVPELSNDFYRFIWDGELVNLGINPYAHTPNDLISQAPFYTDQYWRVLYHGMGDLSQQNYSCYPVFNQLLFALPTAIFDGIKANVISMKMLIILADIGTILIGRKILQKLNKPAHLIFLFALNPFIILEFTGNLHFEGVMIFFLLFSLYLILTDKWLAAAVFMGIAIQVKLIPILLIPFVFKKLKIVKAVGYTAMTILTVIALSSLMLKGEFIDHFMQSIDLYFRSFEFNASVFYLFREYSFFTDGYDNIAQIGPLLSKIAIVGIGLLAVFKAQKSDRSIFTGMMFALVIYYALATTVHPWYISMILILSIFTPYKFALIWSLLVMLSYVAYANPGFKEDLLFISFEYLIVFGLMFYEIFKNTCRSDIRIQLKSFFRIS